MDSMIESNDGWLQDDNIDNLFDMFEHEMAHKNDIFLQSNSAESILGTTPVTSHLFGTSPSLVTALDLQELLMFDFAASNNSNNNTNNTNTSSTIIITSNNITANVDGSSNSSYCSSNESGNSDSSSASNNANNNLINSKIDYHCKINGGADKKKINKSVTSSSLGKNLSTTCVVNTSTNARNQPKQPHLHHNHSSGNHNYAAPQIDAFNRNFCKQQVGSNDNITLVADSLSNSFNNAMKFKKKTKKRQSEGISLLARPKNDKSVSTDSSSCGHRTYSHASNTMNRLSDNSVNQAQVKIGAITNNHLINGYIRNVRNALGFAVMREHAYAVSTTQ